MVLRKRQCAFGDGPALRRGRRELLLETRAASPVARRANLENGCAGHFFEQRFYSGAPLTDV